MLRARVLIKDARSVGAQCDPFLPDMALRWSPPFFGFAAKHAAPPVKDRQSHMSVAFENAALDMAC